MATPHHIPNLIIFNDYRLLKLLICVFVIAAFSTSQCRGQRYGQVEFHIAEQRPSGTEVGSIRNAAKIDRKVSPREQNKLIFKFLNPSDLRQTASLFSINSDLGTVYTTAIIDRENVCQFSMDCNVEFEVTVTSKVSNFFEIVAVRIVIKDINDNSPRFPNDEMTLFVQESVNVRKELTIVGATDKDKDKDNSVYKYDMKTEYRDVFQLKAEQKLDGTWDLKIIVLKNLDRETKDHYVLYIIAKDNGIPQRSGNVTVHINVTDDNDNAPVFSENVYTIDVDEQEGVNSVVGMVSASDADRGMNAAITYRFSQARGADLDKLFYIDSNSGEIKVKKPLQYDAGKRFETVVEASDRGNPPQASQAVLLLTILDMGNTRPQININPVPNPDENVLAIKEDTSIDTVVAHVRTEDRDQGPNGIVDCQCLSPYFKVNRFEGMGFLVKVARQLDREKQSQVNVTLICKDRGTPKLSVVGWFLIKLLDVNDNAPVFTKNIYKANLTENNRPGEHVLYVRANDRDIGINKQLRYSISMKSAESSFNIDEKTGEIKAGEVFDRETLTQVTFMVKVVDSGKPENSGVASVIVNILDKNDQTPHFTSSMRFTVSEKLPASSFVGKMTGADKDEGRNGEFSFSMKTLSADKTSMPFPFVVFTDGSIRTDRVLYKDTLKRPYTYPVLITDHGEPPRSSTATLTVHVTDSNKHRPRFVFPSSSNNTVRVTADAEKGTVIAMLKATDEDTGHNADLTYFLDPNRNSGVPFAILKHSDGKIVLTRDIRVLRTDSVSLNVSVRDGGTPSFKSDAVLIVQIDSVNGMSGGRTDEGARDASRTGWTPIKTIIILGVAGGLTIIITIIVIIIIIFIRNPRRDNRRQPSGVQEQGDGRHFDKQIWQSVPVDDVSPTREIRDKKSPSDLDLNHGGGGGDKSGGDFKPASNGDIPSKHANDLMDPYTRKHNTTLDTFHVQQPQLYTFKKCTLRAPADDFQSDTSGETTTSDSGRGGSEEDIQLPPLPELREDTSRIIFKTPGSGLKDSRFVQPTYPGSTGSGVETMAFQTFSPRSTLTSTLPSHSPQQYGGGDRVDNVSLSSPYGTLSNPRGDVRTHSLGPTSSNMSLNKGGGETHLLRQKIASGVNGGNHSGSNNNSSTTLSGRSTPTHRNSQGFYSPTHPLSRPTSPPTHHNQQQQQQPQMQHQQQQQQQQHHPQPQQQLLNNRHYPPPSRGNTLTKTPAGPGHYPQDIPERTENPYGKKVTFQTDLTTQNLKTWDLCQKMNIQPEAAAATLHGNSGYPGVGGVGGVGDIRGQRLRPRSQEEDDNTTTSGSYTINLDNDLDIDSLPPPFSTVA